MAGPTATTSARKEVEAAFPGKVTTSFVENVPEGPDAERVIRQLATHRPRADLHHLVRLHEPDAARSPSSSRT